MPPQRSSSEPDHASFVDVRDYLNVLRNRRWTITVITVLAIVISGAYTTFRTPTYSASASILVRPTGIDTSSIPSAGLDRIISMDTESQIVLSTAVAEEAGDIMESSASPQSLLAHVSVDAIPETQVLRITFADSDPARAQAGALAFANAYLTFSTDEATQFLTEQVVAKEAEIQDAQARLAELNQIIAETTPDSPERQDAASEKSLVESRIQVLSIQLGTLQGLNTDPGRIINRPVLPSSPTSPKPVFDLTLGLVLGLFFGITLAFVREWADERVRDRSTLEEALNAPVLAVIPKVREWVEEDSTRLIVLEDPWSPVSEAYRSLRTSVLVAASRNGLKTLMVVSPLAGEGKSTTASNLAVALAQADKRVILVSADLRKPRLHKFFGIPNEPGLSDILLGRTRLDRALRDSGVENLAILPSGPIPSSPAELLQSAQARQTLTECRQASDFVVVDCPPLLAVADGLEIAPVIDGVLLVVEAARTPGGAVEQSRRELAQVGGKIIGGVLNNLDFERTAPETYGYHAYGRYGTRVEADGQAGRPAKGGEPGGDDRRRTQHVGTEVPPPEGRSRQVQPNPSNGGERDGASEPARETQPVGRPRPRRPRSRPRRPQS